MDKDSENSIRKKNALLHSIHETVGDSIIEQEIKKTYTPEEKKMRLLMGLLVMLTGYFATFFMGMSDVFSDTSRISEIATFLVAFGMGTVFASSWYIYKVFGEKSYVGNIVFGLSFAGSFAVLIFGLFNIYAYLGTSIFLMVFGIVGASISAISLK